MVQEDVDVGHAHFQCFWDYAVDDVPRVHERVVLHIPQELRCQIKIKRRRIEKHIQRRPPLNVLQHRQNILLLEFRLKIEVLSGRVQFGGSIGVEVGKVG